MELKNITTLLLFNISCNMISNQTELLTKVIPLEMNNLRLLKAVRILQKRNAPNSSKHGICYSHALEILSPNSLNSAHDFEIFKGMLFISNLTQFNISGISITDELISNIVVPVLSVCNKLKVVDFSSTGLRSNNAKTIFTKLKYSCSNLETINFSKNDIGDDAAGKISLLLSFATRLKEIDLSLKTCSLCNL